QRLSHGVGQGYAWRRAVEFDAGIPFVRRRASDDQPLGRRRSSHGRDDEPVLSPGARTSSRDASDRIARPSGGDVARGAVGPLLLERIRVAWRLAIADFI